MASVQEQIAASSRARRLSGGQIIAEYLTRAQVPYAVGIPGHGIWTVLDAFQDYRDRLQTLQVMHEQSAVHLADGYFRASGRPLAAFTSIGPGAANTTVGMATAYVDSTALLLLTGSVHTYLRGHGVLQELERRHWADFPRVLEPVVKRWWQPSSVHELPFALHRAFNSMLTGRPGPVLLDLPMDVQAESAEVAIPDPAERLAAGRPRPDVQLIERAARLLAEARRPVIVAGGGCVTSEASPELARLAERLGAPVVTTWMGKGAIPEDHALFAGSVGDTASTSGNSLAATADVLLAVGCRFVDWSASSWRAGVSFRIPPTRLVQLDIDAHELGKNYPLEVPLVGDAKAGLGDLLAALQGSARGGERDDAYQQEIRRLKADWEARLSAVRDSDEVPMSMARAVREVRAAMDREAIVVTGAGLPQGTVRQVWQSYAPRTHLTSGGFSTMGFTVPAAIGAKLARPDRQVVGIAGDGDFLQTMQEIAVAAMHDLPVLFVVLNNAGWISIKGGQEASFGRSIAVEFSKQDGSVYSPSFTDAARAFGLPAELVEEPDAVGRAVRRALASNGPALIEIKTARAGQAAGSIKTGWWDVPVPEWHPEQRAGYEAGRREEQV